MNYYTNSHGCKVQAYCHHKSDFYSYFACNINRAIEFAEAITHKLLDVELCEGRIIYIQICGYRKKQIPKRVTTAKQLAEWINKMDF